MLSLIQIAIRIAPLGHLLELDQMPSYLSENERSRT